MNTYENLQIVWSQFFTNKLSFTYIWSNSNIYWFISIQIWHAGKMVNRYLVLLKFLLYSISHLIFEFECKIRFIAVIYLIHIKIGVHAINLSILNKMSMILKLAKNENWRRYIYDIDLVLNLYYKTFYFDN